MGRKSRKKAEQRAEATKPVALPPLLQQEFMRHMARANEIVRDARICLGVPGDWDFDQETCLLKPPKKKEEPNELPG